MKFGQRIVETFMERSEKAWQKRATAVLDESFIPFLSASHSFAFELQSEFTQIAGSFPKEVTDFQEYYMDEIESHIDWLDLADSWIQEAEDNRAREERYQEDRESFRDAC